VSPATWALVAAFGALAIADWSATARGDRRRRSLTKPAATALLVAIAATAGEMAGDARAALVVAVVCCLAGDVALLDDGDRRFLAGLGAFALGHAAYVATALLVGVSFPRLAVAAPVLAALVAFQLGSGMLPGARRAGGPAMVVALAGYTLIISTMVVTAWGTPSWLAGAGATLFAVSDSMIGYRRFVRPGRASDVPVMVTYHAGQLLLIGGLIAGG
jgi:uncharacterized membrane protein YhhN